MRRGTQLAIGLLAGTAADAIFADPRRGHPVAVFGSAVGRLEQLTYRDTKLAGAGFTAVSVGTTIAVGSAAQRAARQRGALAVLVALSTWAVLGAESLRREAAAVQAHLDRGDIPRAREQVSNLVGRDPSALDEHEIVRAAVESVAENTSDAIVAPLFWGAVAGVPGLLGYRAVNTLDAMVGHRTRRHLRFGWAAARLDDLANVVPARMTAAIVAVVSGRPAQVARIVRRDASRHPSPNAGWCEAAYAGALDVRLGGTNVYDDKVEERPFLGDGKPAEIDDLRRAARLERRVSASAAVLAAAIAWARR